MKLSKEQLRVLSQMQVSVQYTARSLNAMWPTLAALCAKGLVGENVVWRVVALFTGRHAQRKFMITEQGLAATVPDTFAGRVAADRGDKI